MGLFKDDPTFEIEAWDGNKWYTFAVGFEKISTPLRLMQDPSYRNQARLFGAKRLRVVRIIREIWEDEHGST